MNTLKPQAKTIVLQCILRDYEILGQEFITDLLLFFPLQKKELQRSLRPLISPLPTCFSATLSFLSSVLSMVFLVCADPVDSSSWFISLWQSDSCMCPIHLKFLDFIFKSTSFSLSRFHGSSLEIKLLEILRENRLMTV